MFALIVCAMLLTAFRGVVEGRPDNREYNAAKQACEQNGYVLYDIGCYKLYDVPKSWDKANATCTDEAAHLVVINDSLEAKTIEVIAKESSGAYDWVGLRDARGNGDWRSVKGDSVAEIFHIWAESHTDKFQCGALKYTGELDDVPCDSERSFICEKEF